MPFIAMLSFLCLVTQGLSRLWLESGWAESTCNPVRRDDHRPLLIPRQQLIVQQAEPVASLLKVYFSKRHRHSRHARQCRVVKRRCRLCNRLSLVAES